MYKYLLEGGILLNSDRMIDAVLSVETFPQLYLDTELGALIEVPSLEGLKKWITEIGNTDRYFLVENYAKEERLRAAHYFVDGIMQIDKNKEDLKKAHKVIDSGDWPAFEDFLAMNTDGWIHGWEQYKNDLAWEAVHEWLTSNPKVKVSAEFEGCDGCAICEATKNGNAGNLEVLQKAFETEALMQQVSNQVAESKKVPTGELSKEFQNQAFVFKVTLDHTKPAIWRRIVVPATYTFFELHSAIVDAMGWLDSHLHSFQIDNRGKQSAKNQRSADYLINIELPDPEYPMISAAYNSRDEKHEYIANWFGKKCKQCKYTYDFGDNWDHTVLFEKTIPADPKTKYPACTGGKNMCPPEDCGGVWGYEHLKEVLATPTHEEHQDMLEWLMLESGSEFDPTNFDPKAVEFEDPMERLSEWINYR